MQSLKREAVLFDFFNGTQPDGTPRVASFRYYKTDGTASEKCNCTRSFEDVTKIIAQPKPKFQKGGLENTEAAKKHDTAHRTTPNLKENNMIRVKLTNAKGHTETRNLKIKLLTHYRIGNSEWFEIIHPSR